MMNERNFDENIRKLLEDFQANYDPESWDSFEKKLDFEEEMDALIRDSLENYEEPFQEEHWELLIEELHRRKVRTIIKRSAEILILLLLVFTTQNIVEQYKDSNQQIEKEEISVAELDSPIPQLHNTFKPIDLNTELSAFSLQQRSEKFIFVETIENEPRPFIKIEKIARNIERDRMEVTSINQFDKSAGLIEVNKSEAALAYLSKLDIDPLKSKEEIASIFGISKPKANGLWISLVSAADVNFINSPFDLNLIRNPIQSQSGSLGLGLGISKDFGNLEVQTGMMYSKKKYFPSRIRKFIPSVNQKFLETSLKNMNFEQVQIPLLAKFHSPRVLGVSLFGTLGVGLNVITYSVYNVRTQVRSFAAQSSIGGEFNELDLRDLPKGVLHGGSFGDNVYASGIVGFGLEKRFNSSYAFNISSTYQRSISKEINPIINRTQQLGISAALKVNLK